MAKGNGKDGGPQGPDDDITTLAADALGIPTVEAANDDVHHDADVAPAITESSTQGGATIADLVKLTNKPGVIEILEQLKRLELPEGSQPEDSKLSEAESLDRSVTRLKELTEIGNTLPTILAKKLEKLKAARPEAIAQAFRFVLEGQDTLEGTTLRAYTGGAIRRISELLSAVDTQGAVAATLDESGQSDEDYLLRLEDCFHIMSAATTQRDMLPSFTLLRTHSIRRHLDRRKPADQTFLSDNTPADELIHDCTEGMNAGIQRIATEEGLDANNTFDQQKLALNYYYQHLMGLFSMIMAEARDPNFDPEQLNEKVKAFAEITLHSMNAVFSTPRRNALLHTYTQEADKKGTRTTSLLGQVPQTPLARSEAMIYETGIAARAMHLLQILRVFQSAGHQE